MIFSLACWPLVALGRTLLHAIRPGASARAGARVHSVLEVLFEYGVYLLRWLCWAADWPLRAVELSLRAAGLAPPKFLGVRVRVFGRALGDSSAAEARVRDLLRDAAHILDRAGIVLVLRGIDHDPAVPPLSAGRCAAEAMFRRGFSWLSARSASGGPTVTVHVLSGLRLLAGCAYPGADWVLIDARTDASTIVHEIGHLADLWRHAADPDSVMTDRPGGAHDGLTRRQGVMIGSSRFAAFHPLRGEVISFPRPTASSA